MTNQLTPDGAVFLEGHERHVSVRYIDPVGVPTIGIGFTLRSRVFRDYWRKTRGKSTLDPGDTMTREESLKVLRMLVDEEYGAAVTAYVGALKPHQYDASSSACFNLGPGAIKWRWGRALREGDVAGAATILSNNYNTAGGRKLAGLVRRRKEEGRLLATGDYGKPHAIPAHTGDDAALLAKLGYDSSDFTANTRRFQKDHPPLIVDGKFGPATRATAKRALEAKRAKQGAGAASPAGAGGGAVAVDQGAAWVDVAVTLGSIAVVAITAWLIYRNRGRIYNALPDRWQEVLNTWWNGD